jgi:methylmalonyl-CoA/ethylmalonyl-CoA epimerase
MSVNRRNILSVIVSIIAGLVLASYSIAHPPASNLAQAQAQTQPTTTVDPNPMTANERFVLPGSNHQRLNLMVGTWRVQQTIWAMADAKPVVYTDITARRSWMEGGAVLQEVMEGTSNSKHFTRLALLTYNNIEQKYELASTDTRTPGVMSLQNVSDDGGNTFTFYQTFTLGGRGRELSRQTVRLRHVLRLEGNDRNVMQQYWTLPTAKEYLAIEYVYTRDHTTNATPFSSLQPHHVAISVPNFEETIQWYEEKLGFNLVIRREFSAISTQAANLELNGFQIEIFARANSTRPQPTAVAVPDDLFVQGVKHIALLVDNLDAAVAELKRRNVQLLDEPTRVEALGLRLCFIRDNNGNLIELGQRI